jgi:CheY-like chemotaxis protein
MKKIVMIEDDKLIADIYTKKLAADGYYVEVAADGEKGFELVAGSQPDLVILDLMVPKLSGVELLRKIRAQPGLASLPVVVFSSTYLSKAVEEAWQAGATKCLSKANCTPKQMSQLVRNLTSPSAPGAADNRIPASGQALSAVAATQAESALDASTQDSLRQAFMDSLPATLNNLRAAFQPLSRIGEEAAQVRLLDDLFRKIHALTGNSGIAGLLPISQMSDALEALLKELCEKPKNLNTSSIRTVALAIDFLGVLFDRSRLPEALLSPDLPQAHVLVVDDEAISRRAITHALEKARLQSVSLEDPVAALELLKTKSFELIFLDVDMPGMTGFELCAKLRALPAHKKTPVVFVTGLTDFVSRSNSTMSGGNDLIAKPFLFMELAVKAIIHVLSARLAAAK